MSENERKENRDFDKSDVGWRSLSEGMSSTKERERAGVAVLKVGPEGTGSDVGEVIKRTNWPMGRIRREEASFGTPNGTST